MAAVNPLPPVGDSFWNFLALWHCFPRQRLTIDRQEPHYDEADAVLLPQIPDASRLVSMRPTRRHGILTLLNCIRLSQVVGYPAERVRMAGVARGMCCDILRDDGSLGGLMGQSA